MISTKQKTIALTVMAIAAVALVFALAPVATTHQAYACGGWGGGWGGGCGGCCGGGWGGGWGW